MTHFIEFGRAPNESDEEWAAACKALAREWAKATGMEHLLPASGMEARSGETAKTGSTEGESATAEGGDAQETPGA